MKNLIQNLLNVARKFTAIDFAAFKLCLVAVGILLGAYFSSFFANYISTIWIVAIIAYVFLMIQVARYYRDL